MTAAPLTRLDEHTETELAPPCEAQIVQHGQCPDPAQWIGHITDHHGLIDRQYLWCDDHKRGVETHFTACPVHGPMFTLRAEPLR